ncbi:MAG: 50S ribosomal protein L14e [Candidatus Aenigmatarchaeota archaeon]|nr:MAG: 50S ribosomal protein L14e [Candidatus Aenigmarchaeota archaeon]
MFEVGRICLKTAGREAGKYCVIVKKMDENFVMVTGPKSLTRVKRRRCNINHLEPLTEKIKIKSDASDAEVLKAYKVDSVSERLGFEKPKKAKKVEPEKPKEKKVEKKVKKEKKEKPKKVEKKPKKVKKTEKKKAKEKKTKKPEKRAKKKK